MAHPQPSSVAAPGFVGGLDRYGDATALVGPAGAVTYRDLHARVEEVARQLAGGRRLVLLVGSNDVNTVVAYLGALRAGHPVLLAPVGAAAELARRYDPDILIGALEGPWRVDVRREASDHDLHPELALLLTTSGSTGSAKLVRLSAANLQANAESIAEYLRLTPSDRAATTLPMYYSYGLSVIHSHLLRGASLIVTDRSVADEGFWDQIREHGATSFAGVPHTIELLDRVGFESRKPPTLRYITQAGGRLAPERVRHYANLARRDGWQFFVMYGQTEATARIAYLPPELAYEHPQCIGVPIPGGSIHLDPLPDSAFGPDSGELVYSGPNVMLGYAESPSDLRLGRTVDELRTGDIARLTPAGLYEIVGRSSRFLKIFGLRLDLQRVEEIAARAGVTAHCVGDDQSLVVAVVDNGLGGEAAEAVGRTIADECGLPPWVVRVVTVAEVPRLGNGKVDYQALRRLALPDDAERAFSSAPAASLPAQRSAAPVVGKQPAEFGPAQSPATLAPAQRSAARPNVAAIYAAVLGRSDVKPNSTFVGLGGDSLSYVEASVRLEQTLGTLPTNWHTMTVRELNDTHKPRRWWTLETSVALRAALIVLIAGNHQGLYYIPGGAHALLAIVGYNFGRFHATEAARSERARRLGGSIARIAIPTMAFCTVSVVLGLGYSWANVFFLQMILQSGNEFAWFLWFVELVVLILVTMLVALSTPWGDALQRRFPFGLPVALIVAGLVLRYDVLPFLDLSSRAVDGTTSTLLQPLFLFAIGWATAKATSVQRRALLTAITAVVVPGAFADLQREIFIVIAVVLLIWLPAVPSTRAINRIAGVLAAASLYIYISHFTTMYYATVAMRRFAPGLDAAIPYLAVLVGILGGIAFMRLSMRTEALLTSRWRQLRRTPAEQAF